MTKLRDWLSLIVLAVVCISFGSSLRSCRELPTYKYAAIIRKKGPISPPKDASISLGERLRGTKEATPELIVIHDTILVLPDERIVSLDWDRGKLYFLSDRATEYTYRLPRSTYSFKIRATDPGFFVKYRKSWWDRRLVLGALYPLDAFARADITFGERIFIQGEVTSKDWRVGVGWRVF